MKDLIKKIWNWIVSIPKDKLLHDYAAALITLFLFAILYRFTVPFWVSFWISSAVALAALIGKEVYDYLRPEGHSVEICDILYGCFGIIKIDLALIIMLA